MEINFEQNIKKGLYVVATPIGNRYDISLRAIMILNQAKIIIAEDTREIKKLLKALNIQYHDKKFYRGDDFSKVNFEKLFLNDEIFVYVSDQGLPNLSDPGDKVIKAFLNAKASRGDDGFKQLFLIPGASAFEAIALLPFQPLPFVFLGFIKKLNLLKEYENKLNVLMFESCHRINKTLNWIINNLNFDQIFVFHELTKINEKIIVINKSNDKAKKLPKLIEKGEYVIFIKQSKHKSDDK